MSDEAVQELIIDSFAGGGGTSEGIRAALGRDPDIAINHDRFALAMHRINHPDTHHLVEDVVTLDAIGMCDGRPIGILWMSPDCKDHSKAKGGQPRDKNIRGLAWACLGWVKALPKWQRPRVVFLENVEEFREWGPLLKNGKRCPVQKGAIFQQFIESWRALGYDQIEWRERRAWWSGAGTIRKRLYVIMRRDGEPIDWPERTHGDPNDADDARKIAAGVLKPWKIAADSIDFSLPCPSIFETAAEIKAKYGVRANRPLVTSTMARLAKGTVRYAVENKRPFIVPVTHGGSIRVNSVDEPLRTITAAHRGEHALVTPFVTYAQQGGANRPVSAPLHTITASSKDQNAVVMPFVTKFQTGSTGHRADEPLHTITAHASETHGGGAAPLGVVAAFLAQHTAGSHPGAPAKGADEPLSTITTTGSQQTLVAAHMLNLRGSDRRDAGADEPLRTVSAAGNHAATVYAFLAKYYGEGLPSQACDEPLHTVTAKPRFGLVEVEAALPPFGPEHHARARQVADFLRAHGHWDEREFVTVEISGFTVVIVDIGMRMLTPRERFNAQGFRPDYIIDRGILEDGAEIKFTAEQQGYMCGNSVCPPEAEALIRANYRPRAVKRPKSFELREAPLLEAAE